MSSEATSRVKTMEWKDGVLYLVDQRKLPLQVEVVACRSYKEVAEAIVKMVVRGAPAIGAAAAFGVAIGAREFSLPGGASPEEARTGFFVHLEGVFTTLSKTRPTAVNLFWAIERMRRAGREHREAGITAIQEALEREALAIAREDVETNQRIGRFGAELVPPKAGILTHCNAGALATVEFGTALAVIRFAHQGGKEIHVYADETRPFLQGARLTAWELQQDEIPVTLITDNMAAYVMRRGLVDLVVVGADRIAANGDVANKIGTYGLAILAREHNIPFYVAAPTSTIDMSITSGQQIPIEERSPEEVTHIFGHQVAPAGIAVLNPAFDVTPSGYVSGIITEKGIVRPPYTESLPALFSGA